MPLSNAEQAFYNTLKSALALGGGALGASTGLLDVGSTSVPASVLGAGLGNAAGQSIENFANNMQGNPTSNSNIIPAAVNGGAADLAGQGLGAALNQGLSKIIDPSKITDVSALVEGLKRNPEGDLNTVFHGGTSKIENVIPSANSGVGGNAFYTTPDSTLARFFAGARKAAGPNDATSVLNSFYQKEVPELNVAQSNLGDVGQRLGLNSDQIDAARKASFGVDFRAYPELLRQMQMQTMKPGEIPINLRDAGSRAADILQNQGIQRLTNQSDLGPQILDWNGNNLVSKPVLDSQMKNAKDLNANILDQLQGASNAGSLASNLAKALGFTQQNQ